MWAGGYVDVAADGVVSADTFVTIHNPNRPGGGYVLPKLDVFLYDSQGNIVSAGPLPLRLGKLRPRHGITVSIASLMSAGLEPFIGKLFLRFSWIRPTGSYYYMLRPWLEVKQVVWESTYYNIGHYWVFEETPGLLPSNVKTWTESVIQFSPWEHYFQSWP